MDSCAQASLQHPVTCKFLMILINLRYQSPPIVSIRRNLCARQFSTMINYMVEVNGKFNTMVFSSARLNDQVDYRQCDATISTLCCPSEEDDTRYVLKTTLNIWISVGCTIHYQSTEIALQWQLERLSYSTWCYMTSYEDRSNEHDKPSFMPD